MAATKVFPPLKKTLLQLLGPSIIFVALSLNGGEMLLWPNLAANYGMQILWPIPIILLLQFVVNLEIERYTLVTGKSVESSLVARVRWLAVVFAVTVLLALVWPAWMTTAGNLLAIILGFEDSAITEVGLVLAILGLLLGVVVFRVKSTYKTIEVLSKFGLTLTLSIILFVLVVRFDGPAMLAGLKGFWSFGYLPADLSRFNFVAALAYGGVAGVLNLVQSEWIKAKGYGVNMAGVNPEAIELSSAESKENYRRWFRLINWEHFLLFICANFFTIFVLAYLGTLLLPMGSAQGFQVLVAEIKALNDFIPFLGNVFALAGVSLFFMANVTILDAAGRLTARLLEPVALESKWLSANRISEIVIYLGILILLSSLAVPSFKQPFSLLVISACLSAFSMWLYPPLLIKLNLSLPVAARPGWLRIFLVLAAAAFYGCVTLWAASEYLPVWLLALVAISITLYHMRILTKTFKTQ